MNITYTIAQLDRQTSDGLVTTLEELKSISVGL